MAAENSLTITLELKAESLVRMPCFQIQIRECGGVYLSLDPLAYSLHGLKLQVTHWDLRQIRIDTSPQEPCLRIPSSETVIAGKVNMIELGLNAKERRLDTLKVQDSDSALTKVCTIVEVSVVRETD